jgi:hypothetical protein
MLIKLIKFDQFQDYYYHRLQTIGIVKAGAFLDSYKVIDERLFFLAVIQYGIEFKKIEED